MFKCCLCGKEYETENAAVKCVNKCSREKFLDGAFQHKNAKYRGETSNVSFNFEIDTEMIKESIAFLLNKMLENGAPNKRVEVLKKEIFSNWDNKTEEEKRNELGRIEIMASIFLGGI